LDEDQVLVVQETEYTGAGKHPTAQLTFARENGVKVRRGDPDDNQPGELVVIPEHPGQIKAREFSLDRMRRSLIRNSVQQSAMEELGGREVSFLCEETSQDRDFVLGVLEELQVPVNL